MSRGPPGLHQLEEREAQSTDESKPKEEDHSEKGAANQPSSKTIVEKLELNKLLEKAYETFNDDDGIDDVNTKGMVGRATGPNF